MDVFSDPSECHEFQGLLKHNYSRMHDCVVFFSLESHTETLTSMGGGILGSN